METRWIIPASASSSDSPDFLPVVQYKLADMALNIEAARALVYSVAKTIDSHVKSFTEESAMAKFCFRRRYESHHEAVQICGGAGYMRDYPMEK